MADVCKVEANLVILLLPCKSLALNKIIESLVKTILSKIAKL